MWILISIFAVLAVLFGAAVVVGRRMREQIRTFVKSNGGSVRSIKPSLEHRAEFYVVFESRAGDLRRAIMRVRAGSVSVIEDRPYHHCLRRPPRLPPGSATEIRLDDLRWQGELQSLPGFKDYAQLVRQLKAGPHEMRIAESDNRFTAILQCFEMQSMAEGDDVGGTLDLVVDGQPTTVGWRTEGECPSRVLVVCAATG